MQIALLHSNLLYAKLVWFSSVYYIPISYMQNLNVKAPECLSSIFKLLNFADFYFVIAKLQLCLCLSFWFNFWVSFASPSLLVAKFYPVLRDPFLAGQHQTFTNGAFGANKTKFEQRACVDKKKQFCFVVNYF